MISVNGSVFTLVNGACMKTDNSEPTPKLKGIEPYYSQCYK